MEDGKRTYHYGNLSVDVDSSRTPEQVRQAWSLQYPELQNAVSVENSDGSYSFEVRAGTKG